jgi:hypothetical protein
MVERIKNMATVDGSGDIGYAIYEMKEIVKVLQEAISKANPGDLLTISEGVMRQGILVNIRPPRHRGPVEQKVCLVRPYGTSTM